MTPHAHRGPHLPPADQPGDSLVTLLIGGAALVLLFFVLCFLLPVMM